MPIEAPPFFENHRLFQVSSLRSQLEYSTRLTKTMAAKRTVISINCRNSDIFNFPYLMGTPIVVKTPVILYNS
jgi:hypothetical protein